jgi:hypothetical protein
MNSLVQFEKELAKLVPKSANLRPFVCEGSPLDCEVFIVGINSATPMSEDFWEYWRQERGFDKDTWFDDYKNKRKNEGKDEISPTRRILECVLESAKPIKCLETNVYPTPTPRASELGTQQRTANVFNFLLATIKPKLIVAYAAEVVRHIRGMLDSIEQVADWEQKNKPDFDAFPVTIKPNVTVAHGDDAVKYIQCTVFSTHVIPVKHFIYFSEENATKLGQKVKSVYGEQNPGRPFS